METRIILVEEMEYITDWKFIGRYFLKYEKL